VWKFEGKIPTGSHSWEHTATTDLKGIRYGVERVHLVQYGDRGPSVGKVVIYLPGYRKSDGVID